MGKGQRSREARAGKREEMKIIAAKKRRQRLIGKIAGICAAVIIVLGIVGVVIYSTVASTGFFLRNTVAMSTENFKVDNAMMTYYVKNQYYSFTNTYSDYLSMYGLDTSLDLKDQEYGDGTWFDYFLEQAKTQVTDVLACAEKAKADGYTLDEEDTAEIDETIAAFESYAEQSSITVDQYLAQIFGEGINKDDIRRAIELSTLASKYYTDYEETLKYTDDDLQTYFNENKSNYVKADYMSYGFTASYDSEASDDVIAAAKNEAKANAEKLAAATTVDEYKSILNSYLTSKYEAEKKAEDTEATEETETVEELVASDIEAASSTKYYTEDKEDEVGVWMFGDGRKAGDTYIELPADDATTFTYTAYVVVTPEYYDNYTTVNARHILFSTDNYGDAETALNAANETLEAYNSSETKTEEYFEQLAKEKSDDANVETNGGLYEGVTKNTSSYPEEFVNWCYDASRKPGDVAVIETESGAHMMYFVGEGGIAWKEAARADKTNADLEAHVDELIETYSITSNDAKMNKIDA